MRILNPLYRNRAWIIVDGDQEGVQLTERLRNEFPKWASDHFRYWRKPAFEGYYPSEFSEAAKSVLTLTDRRKRKEEKEKLLLEVLAWIAEDEERARTSFLESAAEVVEVLQDIESQLETA